MTTIDTSTRHTLYRLWIGGGTLPLTERGYGYLYTADEVRRHPSLTSVACATTLDQRAMHADIEVALTAGSGHGSCGFFGHGTAAGSPSVTWRLERCNDQTALRQAWQLRDARDERMSHAVIGGETDHQRALREIADADRAWRSRSKLLAPLS